MLYLSAVDLILLFHIFLVNAIFGFRLLIFLISGDGVLPGIGWALTALLERYIERFEYTVAIQTNLELSLQTFNFRLRGGELILRVLKFIHHIWWEY